MRMVIVIAAFACKGDRPRPIPLAGDARPLPPADAIGVDAAVAGNTIRGRLTIGGQPFAHGALELCNSRHTSLHASTPCAGVVPRLQTRTDRDGNYSFSGLPDGAFGIYVLEAPYHTYTMQFRDLRSHASLTQDTELRSPETPAERSHHTGPNTVRGRLVHHDKPLAHVALEACPAHGWDRDDPTPCWSTKLRAVARADADGKFVFAGLANGDHQIVMLEQPFYPRMVFALGLAGGTRDLGTMRVRTNDEAWFDTDDESADQWPDVKR